MEDTMRTLALAAFSTLLAITAATVLLPAPVLAQDPPAPESSTKLPGGLSFGHAQFAGDVRPGLSATWNAGKNASFTLGAGGTPPVNSSPPSVSGSMGLTIHF
jgi:hypothetical protein